MKHSGIVHSTLSRVYVYIECLPTSNVACVRFLLAIDPICVFAMLTGKKVAEKNRKQWLWFKVRLCHTVSRTVAEKGHCFTNAAAAAAATMKAKTNLATVLEPSADTWDAVQASFFFGIETPTFHCRMIFWEWRSWNTNRSVSGFSHSPVQQQFHIYGHWIYCTI